MKRISDDENTKVTVGISLDTCSSHLDKLQLGHYVLWSYDSTVGLKTLKNFHLKWRCLDFIHYPKFLKIISSDR